MIKTSFGLCFRYQFLNLFLIWNWATCTPTISSLWGMLTASRCRTWSRSFGPLWRAGCTSFCTSGGALCPLRPSRPTTTAPTTRAPRSSAKSCRVAGLACPGARSAAPKRTTPTHWIYSNRPRDSDPLNGLCSMPLWPVTICPSARLQRPRRSSETPSNILLPPFSSINLTLFVFWPFSYVCVASWSSVDVNQKEKKKKIPQWTNANVRGLSSLFCI